MKGDSNILNVAKRRNCRDLEKNVKGNPEVHQL